METPEKGLELVHSYFDMIQGKNETWFVPENRIAEYYQLMIEKKPFTFGALVDEVKRRILLRG